MLRRLPQSQASHCSGHLYERLLKVMIHTVTNYTQTRPNSNVKFWFVKNFLSPQFKRFLPHMAKEWGFSFQVWPLLTGYSSVRVAPSTGLWFRFPPQEPARILHCGNASCAAGEGQ